MFFPIALWTEFNKIPKRITGFWNRVLRLTFFLERTQKKKKGRNLRFHISSFWLRVLIFVAVVFLVRLFLLKLFGVVLLILSIVLQLVRL